MKKKTKNVTLLSKVYEYCGKIFPERFFDILYKNENIFTKTMIQIQCFIQM